MYIKHFNFVMLEDSRRTRDVKKEEEFHMSCIGF